MDHPGYCRGPAGLRGPGPDAKRGGGDGTSYHGSRNIGTQSGDTRSCADGDSTGNTDRDHCTRCCNNTVTSQLPNPGGHVRADTGHCGTHSGPDTSTGDLDNRINTGINTGVHTDERGTDTGVHD